jgi:hypothetical protein
MIFRFAKPFQETQDQPWWLSSFHDHLILASTPVWAAHSKVRHATPWYIPGLSFRTP